MRGSARCGNAGSRPAEHHREEMRITLSIASRHVDADAIATRFSSAESQFRWRLRHIDSLAQPSGLVALVYGRDRQRAISTYPLTAISSIHLVVSHSDAGGGRHHQLPHRLFRSRWRVRSSRGRRREDSITLSASNAIRRRLNRAGSD